MNTCVTCVKSKLCLKKSFVIIIIISVTFIVLYYQRSSLFYSFKYKNINFDYLNRLSEPFSMLKTNASKSRTPLTAIVFDFDETIGNFQQLSQITTTLEEIYNNTMTVEDYAYMLKSTMFPYYIRPGMLELMKSLARRKETDRCKVVLYTNNQGGRKWVRDIIRAIELIVGEPKLFDRIIYAYSFRGVNDIGERCRTSHDKKHSDFLACTSYAKNTQIIFVDDLMHEKMIHPNVSYIHIAEYRWNYERNYIFNTCIRGQLVQSNTPDATYLREQINQTNNTSPNKLQYHYDLTNVLSKFIDAHFNSLKNNNLSGTSSRNTPRRVGGENFHIKSSSPMRLI